MPIGSYAIAYQIVDELCRKRPGRVLDLGIGMGFYGSCVRQWLDSGVKPYQAVLHGVEGFRQYNNPVWKLYDNVYVTDIRAFLKESLLADRIDRYDAVIFSDVIEHFSKDEGVAVVEGIKKILNPKGVLLVGTPAVFVEQGAVYDNDFERHRSLWTEEEFKAMGFEILRNGKPCVYGHRMILAKFTH